MNSSSYFKPSILTGRREQLPLLSKIISLWPSVLNLYSSATMCIWKMHTCVLGPDIYFGRSRTAALYAGHIHLCAPWSLLFSFHSGRSGDIDVKSVVKLVGRVLLRNSFLLRRLAGNDCMKPKVFLSYDFCIPPSGDRGWVLVTKLDCQKKNNKTKAERVVVSHWLFSSSKYILSNARSYIRFQQEGQSLHHQLMYRGSGRRIQPKFCFYP